MKVNQLVLELPKDYLTSLEIFGSCNTSEAKKLEKIARICCYTLGFIGRSFIDINGYKTHVSTLADTRIKHNQDSTFKISYDGARINLFLRRFQRKFGKIEDSKIIYD